MLNHYYLQNKTTGELLTYSQARKEFYSVERSVFESIFDEYIETDILSDETVEPLTKNDFITSVRA